MAWPLKPIGEFCKTGSGGTPSRKQEEKYYGGSIPWVKSGELRESVIFETEELITEAALSETGTKMIPSGALLVAMYGATVGRIATLGIPASSNQAVCHIVPDDAVADRRYMFYALSKQVPKWLEQRVGGAQPNISQQIIRNTKIPLPPIAEQRRIAAILDKADGVRRKRKAAISLTEELLRSAFLEMFGDPVTNPKGWEVVSIGDFTAIKTGKTPSREDPENYGGNVRWVKTTEVKDRVIYETEEHLTEKGASQMKVFPKDSILVAMYGQGATRGRTALLGTDCTTNQACAAILPNASYSSVYLWSLLMLSYERLRELGRGGNQPNLNLNIVKSFDVLLPPLDLQDKFAQLFTKLNSQKKKLNEAVGEHDNLFNSLLQRAFRGEL